MSKLNSNKQKESNIKTRVKTVEIKNRKTVEKNQQNQKLV